MGGVNLGKKKNNDENTHRSPRLPRGREIQARVISMLGANRVRVHSEDGETRIARIPGKMQKRNWIREDDVVLIEPWDFQDEKADIKWRYKQWDVRWLKEHGKLKV
ncbi:translation initiation factor eIF-1A [Methanonatronarchaeum sp. AMET-Sl]|uniref:translation initiation factor eIF-1A n=1 Tax=Methanonatronarchaeum sp. AMET-Sl TaxID=3037654 RepID=UPI00244E1DDD|nr:translation initiation factor eIF-1A [Methanonatronarchaeum sp. AMET-Sl]WGI17491.1 translation initiation factor eIF-1A [Methanonatronarchaeum sp. AMET-Sl]